MHIIMDLRRGISPDALEREEASDDVKRPNGFRDEVDQLNSRVIKLLEIPPEVGDIVVLKNAVWIDNVEAVVVEKIIDYILLEARPEDSGYAHSRHFVEMVSHCIFKIQPVRAVS